MSIDIRLADLTADRDLIIDGLREWLTPESNPQRYDWLYRDNPAGEARVLIATDSASDTAVGISAAFPRLVLADGAEVAGWVLGDFCINPSYRSLGPALKLQRASMELAKSEEPVLCYDFPSQGMMAIYKRMGLEPAGSLVRLARPLRVDRHVREKVDVPGLTQALSAAGNLALGVKDALATGGGLSTALQTEACGDDFSTLAERIGDSLGACVKRSAAYVNWRYRSSTYCDHEILTGRRDGELLGYAVFTCSGDNARLVDLYGIDDTGVIAGLVKGVVRVLRKRKVATLSAPIWDSHRWLTLLKGLGFWPRETSPVIIFGSDAAPSAGGLQWFLWHGDRDS